MEDKKKLEDFQKDLKEIFGKEADLAKVELLYWKEKMIALKLAQLNGTPEEVAELKKSEAYLYASINNLAALHAEKLERGIWEAVERALKLLRNVLLTP